MQDYRPLSAAQRAKIRRLTRPRETGPDEEGGELNVVPFLDIITNILIFVLATVAVTFTASIESTPPAAGGRGVRREVESRALNLTVMIVDDGFALKAAGGNVATGCVGPGPGLAVPKRAGRYDYAELNACAAKLKGASPEYADERQFYVSANPGIEYQTVISVIDALRTDLREPTRLLFTDVNFQVPR